MQKLEHGLYLDSKSIMDNVLPTFREGIKKLIPEKLHYDLSVLLEQLESDLAECDVGEGWITEFYNMEKKRNK